MPHSATPRAFVVKRTLHLISNPLDHGLLIAFIQNLLDLLGNLPPPQKNDRLSARKRAGHRSQDTLARLTESIILLNTWSSAIDVLVAETLPATGDTSHWLSGLVELALTGGLRGDG